MEPFSRQHVLRRRLPRGPRRAARSGLRAASAGRQPLPLPPDWCVLPACLRLEWRGMEWNGLELEWLPFCGYDAIPGSSSGAGGAGGHVFLRAKPLLPRSPRLCIRRSLVF